MEQFVETAPESSGPRQLYSDFRTVLDRIERHPNRSYFIYKSIILDNLYGVDIMDEAVEICKLRLFLKLASQLESAEQIEPLPDIDFNIRAGNTLIGYTSMADVRKATEAKGFDFDDRAGKIEAAAQDLDAAFKLFREQQTTLHGAIGAENKVELRERLSSLEAQLDRFLANDYGLANADDLAAKATFERWKASYKPFHWLIEFYGVIRSGGFDAVVGNPPYIAATKVSYLARLATISRFPDIYGYFLLRSQDIAHSNGRCGMIVPLSLVFSEDFKTLRKQIRDSGAGWYSSFDNIPAALFTGVSQRCTIWISSPNGDQINVSPMYRWRTAARQNLVDNISHTNLCDMAPSIRGLPKVGSISAFSALNAISQPQQKKFRDVFATGRIGGARLGFSQAARNFVSAFLEDPPCLDETTYKRIPTSEIGGIRLVSEEAAFACKSALLGEFYFLYWLMQGDGFHVTSGVIKDYIACLCHVQNHSFSDLVYIGKILHQRRKEALVFKRNAGKYVGNYNYRSLHAITRRSDLVLMEGLGLPAKVATSIFDEVQRVLSANPFAGEKGIPDGLRAALIEPTDGQIIDENRLAEIDERLRSYLGFSDKAYDFLLNHDVVLASAAGEDDAG